MGVYLNPDGMNFKSAYEADVFVDKSDIIRLTNHRINNGNNRFVYVSRPRRFGKSYIADMLCAYYSKESVCSDIFDKLNISRDTKYKDYKRKYNVIYFDMHTMLSAARNNIDTLQEILTERLKAELKLIYPDFDADTNDLTFLFSTLYAVKKEQFIFIIDEWDCVFRVIETDSQKEMYLNFFRSLMKGQSYVALAYMTGILPVKQYGRESILNMFYESSMVHPGEFAEYVGFTSTDVQHLCKKYSLEFDKMKYWYDGYLLGNTEMYCPNSVVSAIANKQYRSYWTQTTAYENLADYIARNDGGLHDDISTLLTGQRISVKPNMFSNDMFKFRTKNDILVLLIHLGYLACIPTNTDGWDETYEAFIPNNEISMKFADSSEQTGLYEDTIRRNEKSMALLKATLQNNADIVAKMIDEAHSVIDPKHYNTEEALRSVIREAYIMAHNFYDLHTELPAGKGFADVAFIPKPKTDFNRFPPILVELKYNQTAQTAIDQINDREYQKFST